MKAVQKIAICPVNGHFGQNGPVQSVVNEKLIVDNSVYSQLEGFIQGTGFEHANMPTGGSQLGVPPEGNDFGNFGHEFPKRPVGEETFRTNIGMMGPKWQTQDPPVSENTRLQSGLGGVGTHASECGFVQGFSVCTPTSQRRLQAARSGHNDQAGRSVVRRQDWPEQSEDKQAGQQRMWTRPESIDTSPEALSQTRYEKPIRCHMISARAAGMPENPQNPNVLVPRPPMFMARVSMGDQGDDLMDPTPVQIQNDDVHENISNVSRYVPPVQPTTAEEVLDAVSPIVGGIAAQVSNLGQRIEILGRVGQSAESCFSLYEERLQKNERGMVDLKAQLEATFPNVRLLIDQNQVQDAYVHATLNEKFESLAILLGETDARLDEKIGLYGQRWEFYNHEQSQISQRGAQLEHDQLDTQNLVSQLRQNWANEIAMLRQEVGQSNARVQQEIATLQQTGEWAKQEVVKAIKMMSQARETPQINAVTVLQPQIATLRDEIANLRETQELVVTGVKKDIMSYSRVGEKTVVECQDLLRQVRDSDTAQRISAWTPLLNALQEKVSNLETWVAQTQS